MSLFLQLVESILKTAELVPDPVTGHLLPPDCPSVGSLVHTTGLCKPCVFAHKMSRVCLNGINCAFCHYSHAHRRRRRQTANRKLDPSPISEDITSDGGNSEGCSSSPSNSSSAALIMESLIQLLLLEQEDLSQPCGLQH
ncbi:hypothetical protein GNI_052250 [Gregarina niphandrodes]|uniref:C3H1-type domain-containing protein n=1 Tax=Gregarina niphandrodes TaxID=110365 RepID=A0A023B988_GRENI|nr:hypothetical protein GNI_052250 [Gregarina niphandrodes]EZG71761.1 hypothetical protein GNI_052250 [Gregarina niphandrodes]|eukprot:XP_011129808.1 hypothetical protein GNI_052250 [Gregarina niphandrodes]